MKTKNDAEFRSHKTMYDFRHEYFALVDPDYRFRNYKSDGYDVMIYHYGDYKNTWKKGKYKIITELKEAQIKDNFSLVKITYREFQWLIRNTNKMEEFLIQKGATE